MKISNTSNARKYRPNLMDPAGPITEQTLQSGLIKMNAAKFDEAWRCHCELAEQIDFIDRLIYDGPPDGTGNITPRAPDLAPLEDHLRESAQLIDRLYFDFWAALVPQE